MGTGASAARREARRQATRAYYKALKETQRMKEVGSLKSNSSRQLDDATGGSLDYSTKRKAMQADKLAREINKIEKGENGNELNEKIGKFNSRYNMLQKQLSGERITRYIIKQEENNNGIAGLINNGPIDYAGTKFFDDEASAKAALDAINANKQKQNTNILGFNQKPKATIKAETVNQLDGFYRNYDAHRDTFNELKQYADNVNNSQSAGLRKRYGGLALQIKNGVSKSMDNAPKQVGLLGSELASSKPLQEVIPS